MKQRRPTFIAESLADEAFQEGQASRAVSKLRWARRVFGEEEEYPHSEHFFRLKEIAAPFYTAHYELQADGWISNNTLEDMQDVHAFSVEAAYEDLEGYRKAIADKEDREVHLNYRGTLTEKVIFALGARGFNAYQRRFLLPASAEANISRRGAEPKDFDVVSLPYPANGYQVTLHPVQVKTDATAPHNIDARVGSTPIVGLRQIDPTGPTNRAKSDDPEIRDYRTYAITRKNALPQLLVNEIEGNATDGEIARIDEATRRLYDTIFNTRDSQSA